MHSLSLSARGPELSHTGVSLDGSGAEFPLSAPTRALSPISSPTMDHSDAGADSFSSDQFAICNLQSAISNNLPFATREDSHPENASGRQSSQEAFSSNLPDARDGANPCPADTERVINKNENEAGTVLRSPGLPSLRPSRSSVENPQSEIRNPKSHQLHAGARRLAIITRAAELRAAGKTWQETERALNIPAPTLIRWTNQALANMSARVGTVAPRGPSGNVGSSNLLAPSAQDIPSLPSLHALTAADCCSQNHRAGRPPKHKLSAALIAKIKSIALPINHTATTTSLPEAMRRASAAGLLPPDLVAALALREQSGQPLLTDHLRTQLALSETEIRAYRSPNEAALDYIQSPGSLMLTRDPFTDAERFYQPGEAYTIDDGSINLGCCVPMERPGDKCWEKFGVIVGRFQFIPVADHRTRCLLGFSFTARPRDSYRAEDLTATMQTVFAAHGIPRKMFLEYGPSDSNLVNDTLRRAGVEPVHVNSPHQKIIEALFNLLWTKLSSLPGQVGRFRGEMEEENRIMTACKAGYKDPRKHFPSLPEVLAAMRQAIAELNQQMVHSPQYGSWRPGEWFARDAAKVTRRLAPEDAWIFSPVITPPLVLRGYSVSKTVRMMPGFSLKFDFGADFFGEHVGDEVILHFNPFAPDCEAMVIHARSGKVLGPAQQINRHARFTRRVFGYGNDEDIGHIAARKHAQAMHRTMLAVKVGTIPNGGSRGDEALNSSPSEPSRPSRSSVNSDSAILSATAETRDGLGNLIRAEVNTNNRGSRGDEALISSEPLRPSRSSVNSDPQSEIDLDRARATRARRVQIANQLRTSNEHGL
jgi:hypothetical protein